MKKIVFLSCILLFSCTATKPLIATKHSYPNPVNTTKRPVQTQKKQVFSFKDIAATNDFPSARLNDMIQLNDSTYEARIWAENFPINPSPWYAFKIWSKEERKIALVLDYSNGQKHRYWPKLSTDGQNWTPIDSSAIQLLRDTTQAVLRLPLTKDTLWVAAQEIQDHKRVGQWVDKIAENAAVRKSFAGKSAEGRSLYHLNIHNSENFQNKPAILIISRQHPPEVTGFLCMKAFIETIVSEGATNGFLDKYRLLVYPLMNPDGVDLGHFRHNTGGVDLNRDWANYHQPEIEQVTNHMVYETTLHKNEVLLGLDFHSTYRDVYYTPHESVPRKIPAFTKAWLEKIRVATGLEDINESAGKITRPTSSGWFNRQFGATGITYEIGDNTPRKFIKTKGVESARAMMSLLLEENNE